MLVDTPDFSVFCLHCIDSFRKDFTMRYGITKNSLMLVQSTQDTAAGVCVVTVWLTYHVCPNTFERMIA